MPRLAITGDVMLGRLVGESLPGRPPEAPWGTTLPRLLAADARFVNLECVVSDRGGPVPGRVFHFRAPPEAVAVLEAASVDLVNLANNHVLDYGAEALLDTLESLDRARIGHVGAGADGEEAWRPAFVDGGGVLVGLLGITDNTPEWEAGPERPGVAYLPIDVDDARFGAFAEQVRDAAVACDITVVTAHWGPNMRRVPPESFRRFARATIDAGAHLFWGHSAHLFQGMERHGDGIILYDTGDFLDDYRVDDEERNDRSFLFTIDLDGGRIGAVDLTPVEISPHALRVDVARGEAARWACDRMVALSKAMGTSVTRAGEGLHLAP